MWGYYGSKSKVIDKYPPPKYDKIIEPFAGTAQYSLLYWDKEIHLIEKYDVIVNLWKWLQKCSKNDILSTRRLKCGENTDDFKWDCQEQKDLVGFIITGSPSAPKKTASKWKTVIRPNTQDYKLNYIADNLDKIKHWKIELGDYDKVKNEKATWFVDPPYFVNGKYYKYGSKLIDYSFLANWCKERKGQVIACESDGASWLPFVPLLESRGNKKIYKEYIWIKEEY
jgi:hypothetical protein